MTRLKRPQTRRARSLLFGTMLNTYNDHECVVFRLPETPLCVLCFAWPRRLAFAVFDLLDAANLVTDDVRQAYQVYCDCFPPERVKELLFREKFKMLNLPWLTCPTCKISGSINNTEWTRVGVVDETTQTLHCNSCGTRTRFTREFISRLYRTQKSLLQQYQKTE